MDSRDAPSVNFRPERVGLWLCLAGAALGALGLLDGLVGPGVWTTLFPREVPMRPNTALGLGLIGGAGALRYREDAGRLKTIL